MNNEFKKFLLTAFIVVVILKVAILCALIETKSGTNVCAVIFGMLGMLKIRDISEYIAEWFLKGDR